MLCNAMRTHDDLVTFSVQHPWGPGWPPGMVRHLLQLISSESLILDIVENGQQLAAAVLVDRVKNPGNHASVEVLGMRSDANPEATLSRLLAMARERLPAGFTGFEVTLPDSLGDREALIEAEGLVPYYETFGMIHESPSTAGLPPPGLCTIVTDRDEEELYRVLEKCLAENVDANIPEFATWQAARRAPSRSKTWGIWKDKNLVAFCNLFVPNGIAVAEIRTLGVLPEHRGQGFAQALIRRSLA